MATNASMGNLLVQNPSHCTHCQTSAKVCSAMQLVRRGEVRRMNDDVDAFDDGGWWEGRITHVLKAKYKVKPFNSTTLTVSKEDVRASVVWDESKWKLRQPDWKVAKPAGEKDRSVLWQYMSSLCVISHVITVHRSGMHLQVGIALPLAGSVGIRLLLLLFCRRCLHKV